MANPLENFLDFRKFALWQKKGDKVLGVDIGASSIKVVQLRRDRGQAILETYGEIATGPYRGLAVGQAVILSADKLLEALKDLLREANVTTAEASLSLPLGSSLLVIIEIPKVSEEMLGKVVPIEARKYIPVPISEVAIDWWVLPAPALAAESDKLEVLVVAIHNNVVKQYQELAAAAGLVPAFFEIETFSAIRSVFGGEMQATVILDIGANTTKMAIVDYGIVRLSHTIVKGSQDITMAISRALAVDFSKAEEIKRKVGLVEHLEGPEISSTVSGIVEYIFAEVNKVIANYQARQHRTIHKIILIGSGSLLRGLVAIGGRSFEVPIAIGKPFSKVQAPAFLEPVLAEAGPGFAAAIGLALRHLQSLE